LFSQHKQAGGALHGLTIVNYADGSLANAAAPEGAEGDVIEPNDPNARLAGRGVSGLGGSPGPVDVAALDAQLADR
jgi:hypothetical protein